MVLESDIELPDADDIGAAPPDCVLRHRPDPAPPVDGTLLGEDQVFGDVRVRSFRIGKGYRLQFDDTGAFDISAEGSAVTWWSGGRAPDAAVQVDVLGRVLAFVLHARRTVTLHAAAVNVDGHGIAFVGPKFYGKSSIASALVGQGAELITDDSLAIELGNPPRLLPGVRTLRLWPDTADLHNVGESVPAGSKVRYRPSLETSRVEAPIHPPLSAIYLLRPQSSEPGLPAAARTRCRSTDAVIAIVSARKLGALLGSQLGADSFDSAVTLANTVPTYWLSIVRDLPRLGEAATLIRGWHAGGASPGRTG